MKPGIEKERPGSRCMTILEYAVTLAAYTYLVWVLVSFDDYGGLAAGFAGMSLQRGMSIVLCVALMPLNWLLESLKWQKLVNTLSHIGLKEAYRSVLSGLTAGFFTPNRIGDPLGRIMTLEPGKRTECAALSVVGIMGQNFATVLCGSVSAVAFIFLHFVPEAAIPVNVKICAATLAILCAILYFSLPYLCKRVSDLKFAARYKRLTAAVGRVSFPLLFGIGALSIARFCIYCTQYFLILRFFGIELGLAEAAVLIPLNYLLVTLTPSVAFAEPGIRGSYAALLIGTVSEDTAAAALSGMSLWLLNYAVPMIIGSVLLLKENNSHKRINKNEENKNLVG